MMKEVLFNVWCKDCRHAGTVETDDPCNECLGCPFNEDSTKPIFWKEKDNGKQSNDR